MDANRLPHVHAVTAALCALVLALPGCKTPVATPVCAAAPFAPAREPAPPRALTDRAAANLAAFARLYGYLRWFHPSDQAAAWDWANEAVAGAQAVEDAPDAAALAARLQAFFAPVAPTVQVFPADRPAAPAPVDLNVPFIAAWEYRGLRGDRRTFSWGEPVPAGVAPPTTPYEADLGGGVAARVPTTAFVKDGATQPAIGCPPAATVRALGADDRTTRLAAVVVAWARLEHFAAGLDVMGADWQGALLPALRAAAEAADAPAAFAGLRAMLAAARDGQAAVTGPGAPTVFAPIAVADVAGEPVVTASALDAVAPGDVLTGVGELPATEALAAEAARLPAATERHARALAPTALLTGQAGALVKLRLRDAVGAVHDVDLTLGAAPLGPPALAEAAPGVWYLDLTRLSRAGLAEALPRLAAARALVLDCRGPLADADLGAHLADAALPGLRARTPILRQPDRREATYDEARPALVPQAPILRMPRVFLQDARSVGAAEALLIAAEAHALGPRVGAPSAGSAGEVATEDLPGGWRVAWTATRLVREDDRAYQGVGTEPTIAVAPTRAGVAAGRDEARERAIAEALRLAP